LGDGKGGFTASTAAQAGPIPCALVSADFNGDGKPDLAVADSETHLLYILIGNGDGTFSAGATMPLPPPVCTGGACYSLATADLNNDGKADLIVMDGDPDGTRTTLVNAYLGSGDGTFGEPLPVASALEYRQFAIGDFNGDGNLDLVLSNEQNGPLLFLGNGDGTFQKPLPLYNEGPSQIVAGDFNGDGKLDLAFTNVQSQLIVDLGNGDGTFRQAQTIEQIAEGVMAVADLNKAGRADLFVANIVGKAITIYLANPDGTLAQQTGRGISCVTILGCGAVTGDLNGDGKLDIFAIQTGEGFPVSPLTVLINTTR
jgi:hypothetical protein